MRAAILLAFFAFVQIVCYESQNDEFSSDLGEVHDRQVQETELNERKKMGKKQKWTNKRSKIYKNRKRKDKGQKIPTKKRTQINGKNSRGQIKRKRNKWKTNKKGGKRKKNDKGGRHRRKLKKKAEKTKNVVTKTKRTGANKNKDGRKISKNVEGEKILRKFRKKAKKSELQTDPGLRFTDVECSSILLLNSMRFNVYQTQLTKAKRIRNKVNRMDGKLLKASTTFKNASIAIQSLTSNGTQCNGASVPEEAKVAFEKLVICNSTASSLCNSRNISGLLIVKVDECIPKLDAYISAYRVGF